MDEAAYVSTAQVAKALGVGVSTVKRWVDEGVLPGVKTAGGHRKLRLADVLRLAKDKDFPHLDLRQLATVLPVTEPINDVAGLAEKLYASLRQGHGEGVEGLLRGAYLSGLLLGDIADRVIQPAMERIGTDWETGRIDVLHEHRATQICVEAILGIKRILETRAQADEGPLAIGGSPEGQGHALANLLAELLLLESGWRVTNLGVNTPLASFRKALKELRPQLVWLSVSPLADPELFLADFQKLQQDARQAGVSVAVGGLGLTKEIRSRMQYTTFGDGLTQLVAFARSLHPMPKPRARGRPVRTNE